MFAKLEMVAVNDPLNLKQDDKLFPPSDDDSSNKLADTLKNS